MILEVSQKQAYIFASTKLKDNIAGSEAICQVTDPAYFYQAAQDAGMEFIPSKHVVYSGGGHTVLEFEQESEAKAFAWMISKTVKAEYPEIALFIRTIPYDEKKKPGENLKDLSAALEVKKSIRAAAFHQGTFGIEKMDANTRRASVSVDLRHRTAWSAEPEYVPAGCQIPKMFEDLGNKKDDSSFIAVIHIDGNAMGKRVERIRLENQNQPWDAYKAVMKKFSDSVDSDFKAAYQGMMDRVADNIKGRAGKLLELRENYFPVRRIILAGDDVCFVTEGRIGLEAARIFIEELGKRKNAVDGRGYTACAGVAVVHQKYPFYKAYELAEMLCSNAKRYLASLSCNTQKAAGGGQEEGAGEYACAIDWHIEFGELSDSLADMRSKYTTADGHRLELRPYLLSAVPEVWKQERVRRYENFRTLITGMMGDEISYARGKLKEFREVLKEGERAAGYYLKYNLMEELALTGCEGIFCDLSSDRLFSGKGLDRQIFIETADHKKRSLYFDAIELLDTFVRLD